MYATELRTLTEEQRLIQDSVDDLGETYDHAYWRRCIEDGEFVDELWEELGDLGFLGTVVPEKYGGSGMGLPELGIMIERLARQGVPLFSFVNTTTMAPYLLRLHGSEELLERLLPGIASGRDYFAFGITEPDSGSNSYRISTSATRNGDMYTISGQKTFITGAERADYIQLVARTTPYEQFADSDKRNGGVLLMVDMNDSSIELQPLDLGIPEPLGQYTVFFNDVEVPVENRLGNEDEGFHHVFDALNAERVVVAALSAGLGDYALERASEYAGEREVFDAPIGTYQGVQHPLTSAKIDLELAKLAIQEAAESFEAGAAESGAYANIAKYAASVAGDDAMDAAMQTFGGNAFGKEYGIISLREWTRLFRIAPLNNEMILNQIGESLLGLPRSY
jgi:acyl-CoA dehydrogenase